MVQLTWKSSNTEASAFLKYIELLRGMTRQSVYAGWGIYDRDVQKGAATYGPTMGTALSSPICVGNGPYYGFSFL